MRRAAMVSSNSRDHADAPVTSFSCSSFSTSSESWCGRNTLTSRSHGCQCANAGSASLVSSTDSSSRFSSRVKNSTWVEMVVTRSLMD